MRGLFCPFDTFRKLRNATERPKLGSYVLTCIEERKSLDFRRSVPRLMEFVTELLEKGKGDRKGDKALTFDAGEFDSQPSRKGIPGIQTNLDAVNKLFLDDRKKKNKSKSSSSAKFPEAENRERRRVPNFIIRSTHLVSPSLARGSQQMGL